MQGFFSESALGSSETALRSGRKRKDSGRIDGYDEQLKLVKRARRAYGQTDFRGLQDRRFVQIPASEIKKHFDAYDFDPIIQIATTTNLNAALGGSISITDNPSDDGAEEDETDLAEWRSYIMVSMAKAGYRTGKAIGFIPWVIIPHSRDVGEPRPLNLDNVDVFVSVNPIGEPMYAFFERSTDPAQHATFFQGMFVGRPILNVYVTTWTAPGSDGTIKSVVATLLKSDDYMDDFKQSARRAIRRLANPLFVTSALPLKYDAQSGGDDVKSLAAAKASAGQQKDQVMRAVTLVEQARGRLDGQGFESVHEAMMVKHRLLRGNAEGPRVDIEHGRVLESQVKPETPQDLVQITIMHMSLILTAFGVPPSMIMSESARGRIASGDDANAATIFRNAQMSLKQDLVQFVSQMYNAIHNPAKLEAYLLRQPLDRQVSDRELAKAVNTVRIIISGTPPETELKELYGIGMLKYSAFRRYVSTMHCIPLSDLHEEPQISVMDLLTGGGETLQGEKQEGEEKMQTKEFKAREKEQGAELQAREKETKMKVSAKPKAKTKAKAKKR